MIAAIRRAQEYVLGLSRLEQLAVALGAICLVLGLWLRVRGMWYHIIPVWGDEVFWGNRARDGSIARFELRPLGFMLLTHWLIKLFGYYEYVLRFLPWVSGVLALFCAWAFGQMALRSLGARIFLLAVVALHPAAIDLAREFKPYSVAFFVHFGLLTLAWHCLQKPTIVNLVTVLGFGLLSVFFSQDVVLAYPGIYLALGIQLIRQRDFKKLSILVAGALVTLAVLALHYWFVWRFLIGKDSGAEEYWGAKYQVFFTGGPLKRHVSWWLKAYGGETAMPGLRLEHLPARWLAKLSHSFWILLHVVGILRLLLTRNSSALLLLLMPLAMQTLFNGLGYWPLGSFRTCLFVLAYVAPLAALAVDWPIFSRRFSAVPALIAVLIPLLSFERSWHRWKAYYSESTALPQLAHKLIALQGKDYQGSKEVVVMSHHLCSTWEYYTRLRPGSEELRLLIEPRFQVDCTTREIVPIRRAEQTLFHGAERVWLVLDQPISAKLEFDERTEIATAVEIGPGISSLVLLTRKK